MLFLYALKKILCSFRGEKIVVKLKQSTYPARYEKTPPGSYINRDVLQLQSSSHICYCTLYLHFFIHHAFYV